MQTVSSTYQALLAANAAKEAKAVIAGTTYGQDKLVSVKTSVALMQGLAVGNAVSQQLDLVLHNPGTIPRMAEIDLYVRLNDGTTQSEWLPKGVFFIDTREYDEAADQLTIHAYDAMLKTEQSFTQAGSQGEWPRTDITVVKEIAYRIGLSTSASATDGIDSRTLSILTNGYAVQYPGITLEDGTPQYSTDGAYSMREVLGFIGAMYGGNWCVSDAGKLRLVTLSDDIDDFLHIVTERITKSGVWRSPDNLVGDVHGLAVGGGGGGCYDYLISSIVQNGGGSGYYVEFDASIAPGEAVDVTIGDGGNGGNNVSSGGTTQFGNYASAEGGQGTVSANGGKGAAGGGGGVSRSGRISSSYKYSGGKGGNSTNYSGANGSAQSSSSTGVHGGGGAGVNGNGSGVDGGAGVVINGITAFVGGHGQSSYSDSTSLTGGIGYDGYGDGGGAGKKGNSGVVELTYNVLTEYFVSSLDSSPAFDAISKIVIVIGTDDNGVEQVYTAGTDTGYTLSLACPWGTQAMANALLADLGGVTYQPYVAGSALIDPAAELGDAVYVGGVTSVVYTMETTFDALYTADISAPQNEEIDHEYPYKPKENREIVRKTATIASELRVDVDTITATVSGKIDGTTAQSMINTSINGITLSASAGANQSTITITANGVTVDSAVVTFSSIVADSIVANASITSPEIYGGKFYSSANGPYAIVSEHSGWVDFKLARGGLTPFEIYEDVGHVTIKSYGDNFLILDNTISGSEYLEVIKPFVLTSNVNYGTSAPSSSTPGHGTVGALYFKI